MILLCNLLLLLSISSSSFFLFLTYEYSTIYLSMLTSSINIVFTVTLLLPFPLFAAYSLRSRLKCLAPYPGTPGQPFQSYSPRILPLFTSHILTNISNPGQTPFTFSILISNCRILFQRILKL